MLSEDEWLLVNPETVFEQIKQYQKETGVILAEAYQINKGLPAPAAYERITGFCETNAYALMYHQLKLYALRTLLAANRFGRQLRAFVPCVVHS